MATGIINKVWNIQGSTLFKGTSAQLSDSMEYILNDKKTEQEVSLDGSIVNNPTAQLERECQYVGNDIKTMDGALIGTHNILSSDVKGAVGEMMQVKEFYGKFDGRAALHGIISLPVEESDIGNAPRLFQLCQDVLKEVFPNNQAVFAIHTNTDNLHVHFILNSVGLGGKKIHQDDKFMKNVLHPCINKYAEKYGFTINEEWNKAGCQKQTKTSFAEMKMEMRGIVDQAIERSNDFEEFISALQNAGLKVNVGEYISLKKEGMMKAVRTYNLGSNYTRDAIIDRIAARLDAFEKIESNNYTCPKGQEIVYSPQVTVMKSYKDMTREEQREVVKKLKLGNNPWKMQKQMNWQLNEIADRIGIMTDIVGLKEFYSKDGSLQGTLDGILAAKKKITLEKKMIRELIRKYKPIIDIYDEMKPIQRKAYLYEHEGVLEYRADFERYRILSKRLQSGYGKNILEVAEFLTDCENRVMYANAQLEELSKEYREVKRYGRMYGGLKMKEKSLYEVLDTQASAEWAKKHIFDADLYYVVSETSDVMLRVVKSPYTGRDGKRVESYEITVLDSSGKALEKVDNKSGNYVFNAKLRDLERKYGITNCEKYKDFSLSKEFVRACQQTKNNAGKKAGVENAPDTGRAAKYTGRQKYSFTQAINLNLAKNREGVHVIINAENPDYMAVILSSKKEALIKIINAEGKIQEETTMPPLDLRDGGGFEEISRVQKKYGFSDDIYVYKNIEDAHNYAEGQRCEANDGRRGRT